jgi:AraC-like DNA-binding protein
LRKSPGAIHEHIDTPPSVAEMARTAGVSETSFRKRFKSEVGCSPLDYVTRRRIQEAKRLLSEGGRSITDIAYELGFSSSQYFATVFKRVTGVSPSRYQ